MRGKRVFGVLAVAAIVAAALLLGATTMRPAQELPLGHVRQLEYPVTLDVDGAKLTIAVADTPEQRALGLSRVPELGWDEGVLFIFDNATKQDIDITQVEFPVDVLWLDESRLILGSDQNVKSGIFSPSVSTANERTKYAVMMSGGWIAAHGTSRNVVVLSEDPALPSFATRDTRTKEERPRPKPAAPIVLVGELPSSVLHDVPFVPQAPFGDWNDIRQANACEEASSLMAVRWAQGRGLGYREAEDLYLDMSAYQLSEYGFFHDTSVADTAQRILSEYLKYDATEVRYNIGVNDIREALARGNVVIVPTNGRLLDNPYYTPPGPEVHMVVVIGYEDATQQFITNDPGTRSGASLRFSYQNLIGATLDYASGDHEPDPRTTTAMIVVSPMGNPSP